MERYTRKLGRMFVQNAFFDHRIIGIPINSIKSEVEWRSL